MEGWHKSYVKSSAAAVAELTPFRFANAGFQSSNNRYPDLGILVTYFRGLAPTDAKSNTQ
jgi:hypothetical protein